MAYGLPFGLDVGLGVKMKLVCYCTLGRPNRELAAAMLRSCTACGDALSSNLEVSQFTCNPCYARERALWQQANWGAEQPVLTVDLKRRQARRRKLKSQLADLLRKHAANRAEIAKKILTFVGFDLPE